MLGWPLLAKCAAHLPSPKFLLVGAFCALVNLGIQNAAVLLFDAHYVVACLMAFVVLVPLSFYIHKRITFRTGGALAPRRFVYYTLQWIVLLLVNFALLALFIDVLGLHVNLAIVLVTGIIHVLSFAYSRSYVFKSEALDQ